MLTTKRISAVILVLAAACFLVALKIETNKLYLLMHGFAFAVICIVGYFRWSNKKIPLVDD